MKKLLCVLLSIFVIALSAFSGLACSNNDKLTIYVPDGAPALAIAKFMYDGDDLGAENGIEYNVVSASTISTAITIKTADFVILPVNSATKLYNATSEKYVMASVITHGNFYIVSSSQLTSLNDLKGKIIYTPMRGKVPDWTLLSTLNKNGILHEEVTTDQTISGKVAIRYFNEGADVLRAMPNIGNDNIVGLLPEPAVTTISNKKPIYSYKLDLQEMYDDENKSYPQAVLLVKKSVLDKYSSSLTNLAINMASAVEWAKNHIDLAVSTIKSNYSATTLDANSMTKSAITNCNIYWQSSTSAKQSVIDYIDDIRSIEVSSANTISNDFFN